MNVASAMRLSGGTISDIRIAVNAVAPKPMRLKAVEDAVRGKPANADTGEMAGKLAVQGAVPLQFNGYKIPLMRNLVKRAIGGGRRRHEVHHVGDKSVGTIGADPYRVGADLGGRHRGTVLHDRALALRDRREAAEAVCERARPRQAQQGFRSACRGTRWRRGCFTGSWRRRCSRC